MLNCAFLRNRSTVWRVTRAGRARYSSGIKRRPCEGNRTPRRVTRSRGRRQTSACVPRRRFPYCFQLTVARVFASVSARRHKGAPGNRSCSRALSRRRRACRRAESANRGPGCRSSWPRRQWSCDSVFVSLPDLRTRGAARSAVRRVPHRRLHHLRRLRRVRLRQQGNASLEAISTLFTSRPVPSDRFQVIPTSSGQELSKVWCSVSKDFVRVFTRDSRPVT